MALAVTLLDSGTNNGSVASKATASVSPGANAVLILDVMNCDGAGGAAGTDPTSVTGFSVTWSKIGAASFLTGVSTEAFHLTRWRAVVGASPGSGAVTINFSPNQSHVAWSLAQLTGENTTTPDVQTPVNHSDTAQGGGSVTAAAFADAVNNMGVAAFAQAGTGTTSVGSGWTALANVNNTSFYHYTLMSEYQLGQDLSADCSFSSNSAWAGIDTEIAVAGSTQQGLMMMGLVM